MSKWFILAILAIIISASIAWFFYLKKSPQLIAPLASQTKTQTSLPIPSSTPSPINPAQPTPTNNEQPAPVLYYPMTNFESRIQIRWYGKLVKPTDIVSPCGAPFSGYHDGDDLEVTPAEINEDVPVYAISNGTIREIGPVSGYGGLIVLGFSFNNQSYTAYYGHINLASSTLKTGDTVTAGEKLANLGAQCSTQTDGERKHLHFAIHSGASIDVRGYVPTLAELSAWIDPKIFLENNNAAPIQ